jgi:predicted  nucleic acid-binding Zn-ribbon protein
MTRTYVKIKTNIGPEEPEITKPESPKPETTPIPKPQAKPTPEPQEPEVSTEPTAAAPTVKAKPTKTVDLNKAATQKITSKTRAFDQEISTAQNDLSDVQKQIDSNKENLLKAKGTPDYQKYVDIARDLTTQKTDLTKKVDGLVDQLAQASVNQKDVDVQKFQSANSIKQNTGLKDIPKKDKPAAPPEEEDEEMFVNESVINRIKKLINKMEYLYLYFIN